MPIREGWLVNRPIVDFANDRQYNKTAENLPLDAGYLVYSKTVTHVVII